MSMEVHLNGYDLRELLTTAPKITDQLNGVCRTLDIGVQKVDGLVNILGQPIELWYRGARWFVGYVFKRGFKSDGSISYTAYDPLYYLKRNTDDWYFKNMTATQAFKQVADGSYVKILNLANTGAILPPLHYQGAAGDKVAVDLLARTYQADNGKYWYRYQPDAFNDGLILFERKVPAEIWAFQIGVNLTSASLDESVEETATVIKLINRETGKVVTKMDTDTRNKYGQLVHFEEVDKDHANTMEKTAQELLDKLKKVNVTMAAEGINPDGIIPQLFSADAIYIEEPQTGLIGGYYIRNVSHTFVNDSLIQLSFDVVAAPEIPTVQYSDADKEEKK